jgi:hypothetical protein
MAKIPLPEDSDEYEGVPLSLGSGSPVPARISFNDALRRT